MTSEHFRSVLDNLGNFNVVISLAEVFYIGKEITKDRSRCEFEDLLNDLSMSDHPATGCLFTRSNKRIDDL